MNCEICLEKNENFIEFTSEEGICLNVAPILYKHVTFCFENEPTSGTVCRKCWLKVELFHEFYMRIQVIHTSHEPENIFVSGIGNLVKVDLKTDEEASTNDVEFDDGDAYGSDDDDIDASVSDIDKEVERNKLKNAKASQIDLKIAKPKRISGSKRQPSNKKSTKKTMARDKQIPDSDIYRCDQCEIIYLTKVMLYRHLKEKHMKLPFECNEKGCVESFESHDLLHQHADEYHKRKECPHCKKSIQSDYLSEHIRLLHDESQRVVCSICGKVSKNMRMHKEHHDRLHGEGKLQCDICKTWLANKYSIRKHMTLKHLNTPQQCSLCLKTYANKNSLARHKKLHENDSVFKVKCFVCDKGFRYKFHMQKHAATHDSTEQQPCKKPSHSGHENQSSNSLYRAS